MTAERWLLGALAVVAGVGACVVTGTTGAPASSFTTTLMVSSVPIALAAARRPDTHIALGLVAVTLWAWLRSAADVGAGRTIVVAIGLLVFHAAIALLATTPSSTLPDAPTVRRWAVRTTMVAAATVVVWRVVMAVRGHDGGASAATLAAAVLAVAAASLWVRQRTLGPTRVPSSQLNPSGDTT